MVLDTPDERKIGHDLFLLTNKPVLYVCNVDDSSAVNGNKYVEAVREAIKEEGAGRKRNRRARHLRGAPGIPSGNRP